VPPPTRVPYTGDLYQGTWEPPDDSLINSGWSQPYPVSSTDCRAFYSIAFVVPNQGLAAGYCTLRYQPDHQPQWSQLAKSLLHYPDGEISVWGIAMTGTDSGWLVGADLWKRQGRLVRYDEQGWQEVYGPTWDYLWGIQMLASNDGWIVGENGAIWHYTGTDWQSANESITHTLYALSMVDSRQGWAVGRDGTIVKYDGVAWKESTSPTHEHLRGLATLQTAAGVVEGWAVGAKGTLVHLRSDRSPAWQVVPGPVKHNLHAVMMLATDDVWVVGSEKTILHYDGKVWKEGSIATVENSACYQLWDVAFRSPQEGWAVGASCILRFSEGEWEQVSGFYTTPNALEFAGQNDGWATDRFSAGRVVQHYDGKRWIYQKTSGLQRDDGDLTDWQMFEKGIGWGVFNGHLYHFDNGTWSLMPTPESLCLYTIQMLDLTGHEGWATTCSPGQHIVHYKDGDWKTVEHRELRKLTGLVMVSPTEGWTLSEPGVLHYIDGQWQTVDLGGKWGEAIDIAVLAPNDVWFLIERSDGFYYVARYKDGSWQETKIRQRYYNDHEETLNALAMLSPDEGWLVGNVILHYQNGQWRPVSGQMKCALTKLDMVSKDEGWAIGEDWRCPTGLFHYERSAAQK